MIYLDYAATTPLDAEVEVAMQPFARDIFANPSSAHRAGRQARAALDEARDTIAGLLGARAEEIIFTSGGTEADNLALYGVAHALRGRGRHIVTTAIEHHAVLACCRRLEVDGFHISYLQPDGEGRISAAHVADALTEQTILVSVMYANNEVGAIQPLAEIGRLCRERKIPLHSDAVQAAGELPLRVDRLMVDLLSLSAHKIYGPKGIGALYVRRGVRMQPVIVGGGQEYQRRAGTEPVAGIVGFARALEMTADAREVARVRLLRERLIDGFAAIPDSRLHGSRVHRLAGNVNVGFAGVPGEALMVALDMEGIAVSTGAACAAGAVEASHVLRAMGLPPSRAQEAIRLTLGRSTSDEEIARVISVMQHTVHSLRQRHLHSFGR